MSALCRCLLQLPFLAVNWDMTAGDEYSSHLILYKFAVVPLKVFQIKQ